MAGFKPDADFPAYFTAKGIAPTCESCGHNAWTPLESPAAIPALRNVPFIDYRLPVYVIGCRHCGFVRLYIREAVDEWHRTATTT